MMGNDKTAKLQLLLCELKLEQRHVNTDMSRLIRQGKTIDFFKAKQLNARKSGLAEKINKVENSMNPNIIAWALFFSWKSQNIVLNKTQFNVNF